MGRLDSLSTSQPENLFTAPDGYFNSALLFTQLDQAALGIKEPGAEHKEIEQAGKLGLGFKNSVDEREVERLNDLSIVDDGNMRSGLERDGKNGEDVDAAGPLQRWACKGCGALFQSLDEQRSHFKSDIHRFNVKRKLVGKEAVTEDEFEGMAHGKSQQVDDDVSSISGSETESETEDVKQPQQGPRSNRVYIKFPETDHILLLWRCLVAAEKEILPEEKGFTDSEATGEVLCVKEDDALQRLKSLTSGEKRSPWVILLAAGGHFAGIVVDTQGGRVIAHQTFHRYVVRAKAGGRQSTRDATGRAPKSAGASLRRYNEQALQKEIRELLTSWSERLQAASHLFIYAPSSNAQTLFGGENVILNRNDRRIRRIPFTTRRPTMKEAIRINHLLGTLYHIDKETWASGLDTSRNLESSVTEPANGGQEPREAVDLQHQTEKLSKGKKSKSRKVEEVLTSEIAEGSTAADVDGDPLKGMTLLHEAAKAGDTAKVLDLLEEGADPCVKEKGGRTPYVVATDKETRNVFRRFMAVYPDKWDWHAANVPSPLTAELEAEQAMKQKKDAKRKAKEKERKKLKKVQEKAQQEEKKAADAAAKAAEIAALAATNVRYDKDRSKKLSKGLVSLDPKSKEYQEAMLKAQAQERETRAAAAEFRLRQASSSSSSSSSSTTVSSSGPTPPANICTCCGASLVGKVPFTRFSYQYCSTTCVRVHKMALEED